MRSPLVFSLATLLALVLLGALWRKSYAEGDEDVGVVAILRTVISLAICVYLAIRYGLAPSNIFEFFDVLAAKCMVASAWAAAGMLVIGLVLALLDPRRGRALRLFFIGGRGIGPVSCVLLAGACTGGIYWMIVSFVGREDISGYLADGNFLTLVVMPTVLVGLLVLNLSALRGLHLGFHAGTAHPLLPALASPWFAVGAILSGKVAPVGAPTEFALTPQPVADLLQWGGLAVTIALSLWEYRVVSRDLGVGLRTGSPDYKVENGVMEWRSFHAADRPVGRD